MFFLGQSPKATEIKTKINKWDLIKLTSFLHSKEDHKQNEKTTFRMGKIFANNETDKSLISEIYEQFMQLNKNKQPNLK